MKLFVRGLVAHSAMEDEEDDRDLDVTNAIFCTLQDSFNVVPKIQFNTTAWAQKVSTSESESYEALHQLLTELELLLQTWKR